MFLQSSQDLETDPIRSDWIGPVGNSIQTIPISNTAFMRVEFISTGTTKFYVPVKQVKICKIIVCFK
jgi:hypothetical protein